MWEVLLFAIFFFFPSPQYQGAGIMLFRNRGNEILLVHRGGEFWGFPMNKTEQWDSSFVETATRSLYRITGLEDGKHYTLCDTTVIRLGRHAYYTAHLGSQIVMPETETLRWRHKRDLWQEPLDGDATAWKGQLTCYPV